MMSLSLFSYYYGILATLMLYLSVYTQSIAEDYSYISNLARIPESSDYHLISHGREKRDADTEDASSSVKKNDTDDSSSKTDASDASAKKMEEDSPKNQTKSESPASDSELQGQRSHILSSNESLFAHLVWGTTKHRLVKNDSEINLDKRTYVAYGQCISRWPIYYKQHIHDATTLDLIILAYTEMLRVYCKTNIQEKYMDLFEKGYARLRMDHSVTYSYHTLLFIKPKLSFWDIDHLENLIEFSAFTQVYVAWVKFPVNPIDPMGNEIKDACFIEIVARLHAIDLIMAVARRHTSLIAYLMGVKLKLVIKMMREEFKGIKGHDKQTNHQRVVAKRCLVVTMALAQFLSRKSEMSVEYGCAHAAFKAFYMRKQGMLMNVVERYGRKPNWNLDKHGNDSHEEPS